MKRLDMLRVRRAFIDISAYPTRWSDGMLSAVDNRLVERIAGLVNHEYGFAVCYGSFKVLRQHGLDVHDNTLVEAVRQYLEWLFRQASALFDTARPDMPEIEYDRIAKMDADGYNPNQRFTPNGDHTEAREFVTTKCVHFDAATPFIANVYGPYENISGGLPVICDTRAFCADEGIAPKTLIENIPNNYNVAVKEQYAERILDDYSVALKFDFHNDVVMTVLFNEVNGGVAHAATAPSLTDPGKPGLRPIRHIEYQFADSKNLARWYDFYGLQSVTTEPGIASNEARYHRGESVAEGCVVNLI